MRDYYCTLFVSHDRVATVDELFGCLIRPGMSVSSGLWVPYYTQKVATKTGLLNVLHMQIWGHQ